MTQIETPNELIIKPAWLKSDPTLEADATRFWEAAGALPPNVTVAERLKELCIVGYDGDQVAGVATAVIRFVQFLGCKMAMFRCLSAPNSRLKGVATSLTLAAFEHLENWSLQNPDEKVMGMGAVIQSAGLVKHDRHAVWPSTKLTFVGYTSKGEQFRLKWFAHGTVNERPVPVKSPAAT